jgi:hypothetical protein
MAPQKHNDLPHVFDAVRRNRERLPPGTVYELRVAHDNWCLIFKGGPCNCNPVTELLELKDHAITAT